MSALSTTYLGLSLRSPLVASAGPLTGSMDSLRKLEDAGAAAVVLPSVFEEQVRNEEAFVDHFLEIQSEAQPEAQRFFPDPELYPVQRPRQLELLQEAKAALEIPVIASLNGATSQGWKELALQMKEAGADAIELNLYEVAADPSVDSAELENRQCELVRELSECLKLPLAVKLSPYYSALANMAGKLEQAGAGALVLFNRFYQPDFDCERRTASRRLGLSTSREHLLPQTWISILRSQRQLDLAASSGMHQAGDVLGALMAGADIVMSTSALLKNGPEHIGTLTRELVEWMEEHDYPHIDDLRGCMQRKYLEDPSLVERANYLTLLHQGEW